MIKTGRVTTKKTPSVVSGKRCTRIEQGEPLRGEEKPPVNFKKLASVIDTK